MKKRILSVLLILMILFFGGCELNVKSETEYQQALELKEKYLSALNDISIEFMSSNIMVQTSSLFSEKMGQGSGVIFKKEITSSTKKYYVLTNYHVTKSINNKVRQFSSTDYMDNVIISNLVFEDKNYDLAVITFTSTTDYNVCKFAESNPLVGDGVFAIGQPLGQRNTITFGYVKQYMIEEYDWCDINFECIFHTALINSGNSGGVLLNGDIELCGINFAAGEILDTTTSSISVSIPVEKVKECLLSQLITI